MGTPKGIDVTNCNDKCDIQEKKFITYKIPYPEHLSSS
jgi:hypothetical protein